MASATIPIHLERRERDGRGEREGLEGKWKVWLGTYNCWFCKTNEENKTAALCADLAGTSLSAVKSDSSTRTSDIFEGWI